MPRDKVIRDAQGLLVEQDDAELLSYFYNDGELIYDFLMDEEESDNYKEAKKALNGLLDVMSGGNRKDVVYYSQTNIVPLIKTKEELRFFVDLLSQVYEDVLNVQLNREISLKFYEEILRNLSTKLPHVQSSLVEILKTRNVINLNVNIGLLIDHLIINLMKE